MDSNYIVNRLKLTLYKYHTAQLLKSRLKNLNEFDRNEIVSNLKVELHKHNNSDIHQPLFELLYRSPLLNK